eukprot:TRINITY_DN1815_c0_g1_i1.p1 TRINITY_DN1815_c0_g1~~TRINITY_DN1815_c0_g1_i1.p1  ORF type:complete len:181 (-),score=67.10 TRINITY_DN1815_c0_g1_i1:270-812(-)
MTLDNVLLEPALDSVKALMILDNDGNRILVKYYDKETFPNVAAQKKFEKSLFTKTHKANAEIIMLDGLTCLYKSSVDLFFYVVGSGQENELLLMSVLDCLFNTCSGILRKNVDKKSLCDNMEVIMLALDEMIDGGIILESDPAQVISRAALRSDDIPLGEQTVAQVLQSAKEQLRWSLLK